MPGTGPITLFDKSALQSLNGDEALWFDCFYATNITPLFYVETLADLEKQMRDGRTPEQIVGNIAYKTPVMGSQLNVHHQALVVHDLLGYRVRMERLPIVGGGRSVMTGDRAGIIIERAPELEAFERWQKREFLDVERLYAKAWRRGLSNVDLRGSLTSLNVRQGQLKLTFEQARMAAASFVAGQRNRFGALRAALETVGVPLEVRPQVIQRWKSMGGPSLREFAPYAAHVFEVAAFFLLALSAGLISPDRASNQIDIAYLYYLPFCMLFVSGDKLHRTVTRLFLKEDQAFIWAPDLKADLAELDAHFSKLPAEVKEHGLFAFASDPPEQREFLTTQLWDRFLPAWRERVKNPPQRSKKADARVLERLEKMAAARATSHEIGTDEANFVLIKRMIPATQGKWRILPREVEESEGPTRQ